MVHGPTGAEAAVDVAAAEAQFLALLNQDRAANGLAALQPDQRLMDVARWRSDDMVTRNYLSHDIGGFNIARILHDRSIRFELAGENLVSNTFDDASTVAVAEADLMKSPTHRENILRAEFTSVGVGIAIGPNRRTVYTQVFVQAPLTNGGAVGTAGAAGSVEASANASLVSGASTSASPASGQGAVGTAATPTATPVATPSPSSGPAPQAALQTPVPAPQSGAVATGAVATGAVATGPVRTATMTAAQPSPVVPPATSTTSTGPA